MTAANFRLPLNEARTSELYAFGGYSHRVGTGNGFWRYSSSARNWPELYPEGFLPEFHPNVNDYSGVGGFRAAVSGWSLDLGASFGMNRFDYDMRNTNNASLGPCLTAPCAPGPDRVFGTADDPGIPNQLSFDAGRLERREFITGFTLAKEVTLGLHAPVSVALGAAFRRETYQITAGAKCSSGHSGALSAENGGHPRPLGPAGDHTLPPPPAPPLLPPRPSP